MPRKLKPYMVDQVYDAFHGRIDIYFDRDQKIFFSGVLGERAEADTLRECKKATEKLAGTLRELVWRQVICIEDHEIEYGSGYENTWILRFTSSRHEIADSPAGQFERRFTTTEGDPEPVKVYPAENYPRRTLGRRDTGCVTIPYSQEAWRTILQIRTAIEETSKRIAKLVGSRDLERLLTSGDLKLLPTFTKKED